MLLIGRENVNNIIKKASNYLHQIVKCILVAAACELLVNTNMVLLIISLCSHRYIHASLFWSQSCICLKMISQWRHRPGWEEPMVLSSSVDCRASCLFLSWVRLMAHVWREVRNIAPQEYCCFFLLLLSEMWALLRSEAMSHCHVSPR